MATFETLHWGSNGLPQQQIRVGYGQIIVSGAAENDYVVVGANEIDDLIFKLFIAKQSIAKKWEGRE